MTFLELVQELWEEVGASGSSPGPSTTVSQTGEYLRLVNWTNRAYLSIQRRRKDWGWMRQTASFTTVAGQATYALGSGAGTTGVTAATFGMWARNTGRSYLTSVGTPSEAFLEYATYESWRDAYQFSSLRTSTSRPNVVTITPAKALGLGPVPVAGYTITMDYYTKPVSLSGDSDTPLLPAEFHRAIVCRAMMYYARYESAPEIYDDAKAEYDAVFSQLSASYTPQMDFAGALA